MNPSIDLHISTALTSISFFNTLTVFLMLGTSRNGHSPANRLLLFYLFCMALVMFMLYSIRSGLILHYPWMYRLPSPLYYLMFPAAYLYVRMTLLDELKLRWSDGLHALPALLHLVEYMPYYLLPYHTKVALLEWHLTDPLAANFGHVEGMLPPYAHNMIRTALGIVYALAMLRLIARAREKRPEGCILFPEQCGWLRVFSAMVLLFCVAVVVMLSLPAVFPHRTLNFFLMILPAATQIVTSLTLMHNPVLLYGMPKPAGDEQPGESKNQASQDKKPAQSESLLKQYQAYLQTMDQYMRENKPFLQRRFSLQDMSNALDIPEYHLSYVLNQLLHTRFNDYVNALRIGYLKEKVASEDVSHLSLEGLAMEAGFGSRVTFIRAVQRHTGQNPSEYFRLPAAEEV